ncbi:MAG TPA: hypothetical protein VJZ71_11250 [Phycisphaerae bacterium]|nr:hypothetical protein [Phycisphaerae bacterium]
MKAQIAGLWTSGILFGLMALAQLARLVIRPDVVVSGHAMPLWPSALAFVFLGGMCIWMLGLARRSKTPETSV